MYQKNVFAALIVLVLTFVVLGACGGGGSRPVQNTTTTTTTKGGELLDLKKAYDEGIITQKEYDKQRKVILDRK
ncbi:MAG: SHOCT domain-containing protein [Desulfovibrionaceae bacterium]